MEPSRQSSLPRPAWIGLLLVLAWSFLHFWIQSTLVRVPTPH